MALDVAGGPAGGGRDRLQRLSPPRLEPANPPYRRSCSPTAEQDPVVPYGASEELQRLWRSAGGESELLGFPGGHSIDPALFPALRSFLQRHWPQPRP